jgi:hypothetical protein
MAIAASVSSIRPPVPFTVEEKARNIREQLEALSDELMQWIQQKIDRSI